MDKFSRLNFVSMRKGKVKFFNRDKKFGFIVDDLDQKEYFVHAQGCVTPIQNNDLVEFDLTPDSRGMKAVNVRKI
jgi:CspA family cold shock protein